jgi:DNA-binding NtrC family response regulator
VLRHGGYLALTSSSVSEAVDLYKRNHDRIRAVITDIMMPFTDGRQLIMPLNGQNPKLPIIAMSGLATEESQRETLARGACAFLSKPFTADQLLGVLSNALKQGVCRQ